VGGGEAPGEVCALACPVGAEPSASIKTRICTLRVRIIITESTSSRVAFGEGFYWRQL
jgi:hypothetical protein